MINKSPARSMTKPILEVHNIRKLYSPKRRWIDKQKAKAHPAVDGISFTVHEGQCIGLVGESGSGKSTVALCTMRLVEPTSGQVIFKGQDILTLSHKELRPIRQEMQMIFQNPFSSLNPRKNVLDNMTGALRVHHGAQTEEERIAKGYELLAKVGLEKSALFQYPHQFSGGQQQRIAIGRALALKPKVILCDEAVSALDLSVQAEILNLLHQLKKDLNLSYLFISHDLAVVHAFCDHILVMYRGKIVESGPREQIFLSPKHPYTQILLQSRLKSHPREKRTLFITPEEPLEENLKGCPFYTRCPKREESCRHHHPAPKYEKESDHLYHCIH